MHAAWRAGRATVVEVREHSAAETAGVRPGDEILAIDDLPAADAIAQRMPRHLVAPDPAAADWALDVALAGRQDRQPVRVDLLTSGVRRSAAYVPDRQPTSLPVSARCEGDVAVITLANSLGDTAAIAAFDEALDRATCRAGVVLDLRDTPSGGNTTVARGIIGRFVAAEASFQRHERPSELRVSGIRHVWVERVVPRPPVFAGPVVVLVGHWTGSMGEGLAIGLDAARHATVVGTPMAGLLGAIDAETLPHADLQVRIPTERLSHVDGTPREAFAPCPIPAGVEPLAFANARVHAPAGSICR